MARTSTRLRLIVGIAGFTLLLSPAQAQVWEVGQLLLVSPVPQAGARFGAAMALGDFDDDGDLDLAVGTPFYDAGTATTAGRVDVFRNQGGRSLVAWMAMIGTINQERGVALAAGDFDGDGDDDLAVGMKGAVNSSCYTSASPCTAGAVRIYRGSGTDLDYGTTLYEVGSGNGAEPGDEFGAKLAVGDFDNDGADDLAVGITANDATGPVVVNAGKVNVFYSPLEGAADWDEFYVDEDLLDGVISEWAMLGYALAAGDFDDNGVDDLAMGCPGETVGGVAAAGAVHVVWGLAGDGLSLGGQRLLTYAAYGYTPEPSEHFGVTLAAANFDESPMDCTLYAHCYDDLAIGIPGDDVVVAGPTTRVDAGRVLVSYGGSTGLSTGDFTRHSQADLSEEPEGLDAFGTTLAAGRLRDEVADTLSMLPTDLAIGVPAENLAGVPGAGYVHVAFGSSSGLAQGTPAEQALPMRLGYAAGPPEDFLVWGKVLLAGDLDGDGYGDLLVGLPDREHDGLEWAGVVNILFGAMFADGFEIGSSVNWSSTLTP